MRREEHRPDAGVESTEKHLGVNHQLRLTAYNTCATLQDNIYHYH